VTAHAWLGKVSRRGWAADATDGRRRLAVRHRVSDPSWRGV